MGILSELYIFRKTVIIILTPFLLIPVITFAPDDRQQVIVFCSSLFKFIKLSLKIKQ